MSDHARITALPAAPTLEQRTQGEAEAAPPSSPRGVLEALYRSQAGRLLRLFNRRTDPQEAADLVQETFNRFAQATLVKHAAPESPERYLTRVAVNVLHDQQRSPATRLAALGVPVEDADLAGEDSVAAIEARDMLRRVEAVMLKLKPMTRDIFIARRFHGFSRAEIAAKTGLSVKAVDKHLARAVAHLHEQLGTHDGR